MAKTQTLSFPIRLPDAMQAEALRLLDASRSAINQIILDLWAQLDLFASNRAGPAWKQVFQSVVPLLTDGLIRPADENRPARKDHRAITEQVRALRTQMQDAEEDMESFMAMTNILEQACNRYLQTEALPTTYEQLQPAPILSVGQLTFGGDDGMEKGQTYRVRLERRSYCDVKTRLEHLRVSLTLKLRAPDAQGKWTWGEWSVEIALPEAVCTYLEQGATTRAPTLREIRSDDGRRVAVLDLMLEVPAKYVSPLEQERRVLGFDWGIRSLITVSILEKPDDGQEPYRQVSRPLFLDTGGIDGRQARLRREIDRLKAYDAWIKQCWKKYERRNRELAHLASNLLILLALLSGCKLICGENLSTLKTIGRGRGVRGRFRNWRNNSTVRGEVWRVLSYKCYVAGIRTRQVEPRGTTHTCPHCHAPARTFASPSKADRKKANDWGPWLCCENPACGWNGARDYAASLNIAALGIAFLMTFRETGKYVGFRMTSQEVKSCSYIGQGAMLLSPSQGIKPRPSEGKHVYYAGWSHSLRLCTSQLKTTLSVLSTSQLRKRVLSSA
jgi:putative transposase